MPLLGRLHPLDRVAAALLAVGLLMLVTGLLPVTPAAEAMRRLGPLLAFLATVIVLAELAGRAQVFDRLAGVVARAGRGSYPGLFALCVLFASVTTVALSLDTTAVLLTPVMLSLASRLGTAALPAAMTTVWLANTASLLLPVSNLTNLLAADRIAMSPLRMAGVMAAPQAAAIAVTAVCLWVFYWRPGRRGGGRRDRYVVPGPVRCEDPVLYRVCAAACGGFLVVALLLPVPLWWASSAAALLAVAVFAVRRRGELRLSLVPWRMLVLVPGMFLVVETVSVHGLRALLESAAGGDGPAGMFRAAGLGAGLSNVLNNLPVYLAAEPAVPEGRPGQLLALLIGTNAGPLVTPWASLATLLWAERCRRYGVRVRPVRFAVTGLVVAVAASSAAVGVLALTYG